MSSLTKEGYLKGGFIDLHNQNVEYVGRKLALHACDSGEELNETTMSLFPEYVSMRETGRHYVHAFLRRSNPLTIDKQTKHFAAKAIPIEDGTDMASDFLKKTDSFRKYVAENVFHELTYSEAQKYKPDERHPKSIEDLKDMIAFGSG